MRRRLIDALAAAPAIVIGRSYGGEIAVDLALRYPDRVRALALLEAAVLSLSEAAARWAAELEEQVFAAAEADMSTVAETFLRGVLGDAAWEGFPEPAKQMFTGNGPAIVAELPRRLPRRQRRSSSARSSSRRCSSPARTPRRRSRR